MRANADDEVIRSEPIETGAGLPVAAGAGEDAWSAGWNEWARSHVHDLREEMIEEVSAALGTIRSQWRDEFEAQSKRIKELELKLAQVTGALDVLRGRGAPGSFNVRGTFDPDKIYNALDVVAYNGSSWVAKRDDPGMLPGPGWQLLSSVGKRGARGERGERGPMGHPGPILSDFSFDAKRLVIDTRLADGAPGPVIPLAPLLADVTRVPSLPSGLATMRERICARCCVGAGVVHELLLIINRVGCWQRGLPRPT